MARGHTGLTKIFNAFSTAIRLEATSNRVVASTVSRESRGWGAIALSSWRWFSSGTHAMCWKSGDHPTCQCEDPLRMGSRIARRTILWHAEYAYVCSRDNNLAIVLRKPSQGPQLLSRDRTPKRIAGTGSPSRQNLFDFTDASWFDFFEKSNHKPEEIKVGSDQGSVTHTCGSIILPNIAGTPADDYAGMGATYLARLSIC